MLINFTMYYKSLIRKTAKISKTADNEVYLLLLLFIDRPIAPISRMRAQPYKTESPHSSVSCYCFNVAPKNSKCQTVQKRPKCLRAISTNTNTTISNTRSRFSAATAANNGRKRRWANTPTTSIPAAILANSSTKWWTRKITANYPNKTDFPYSCRLWFEKSKKPKENDRTFST